eukprot:3728551-Pyramimonas_sp.AAC.1
MLVHSVLHGPLVSSFASRTRFAASSASRSATTSPSGSPFVVSTLSPPVPACWQSRYRDLTS